MLEQRWRMNANIRALIFRSKLCSGTTINTHFITNSTYFLWDVLTTAYIGNKDLVHSIEKKVDVISYGPSQGKTFECKMGAKLML